RRSRPQVQYEHGSDTSRAGDPVKAHGLPRAQKRRQLANLERGESLGRRVHDLVGTKIHREHFQLFLEIAAMLPRQSGEGPVAFRVGPVTALACGDTLSRNALLVDLLSGGN